MSGDTIVIGDVGGAVIALDARTGAERWRHSTGGAYVYSTPAIAGGDRLHRLVQRHLPRRSSSAAARCAGRSTSAAASRARRPSWTGSSTPPRLYAPGAVAAAPTGSTPGTGAVRYQADEGRYSPAVAARAHPVPRGHAARRCLSCARAVSASGSALGRRGRRPADRGGRHRLRRWRGAGSTPAASRGRPRASSPAEAPRGAARPPARGPSTATTPSARRANPALDLRPALPARAGRTTPARCWSSRRSWATGGPSSAPTPAWPSRSTSTPGRPVWTVHLRGRVASSPALAGDLGPVHHQPRRRAWRCGPPAGGRSGGAASARPSSRRRSSSAARRTSGPSRGGS